MERVTLLNFSIQSVAVKWPASKGPYYLQPFNTHSESSPESLNLALEGQQLESSTVDGLFPSSEFEALNPCRNLYIL